MISKSTIKLIKSLALSKFRKKENAFVAEGDKIIQELISSQYKIKILFATDEFVKDNTELLKGVPVEVCDHSQIKKASLLKSPQNCLAICEILSPKDTSLNHGELSFFLDDIQDPGNLGTIIRLCDWFGIPKIYCSPSTVDLYNPKVIQATMGSFCRIEVIRTSFKTLCEQTQKTGIPVYGTFLDGKNIYTQELPHNALIVFGNEGKGISKEVEVNIDHKLTIPQFSATQNTESLNVSVAAAIVASEFKRNLAR